ncbi:MAG: metalloregulator ArsR/SmtB family transcription factor [Clostridiaceae bacterium]
MDYVVQIFKALGDETRLKILIILSRRKICAKGIAKHLNISEAAISQHLKILREAGIITGEKVGYYVHYKLQELVLEEVVDFINKINSSHDLVDCKLGVNIPKDCRVDCKVNKIKCCQEFSK